MASKIEVEALEINLVHRCVTLEVEMSKASRAFELKKENALLIKDLEDECYFKYGAHFPTWITKF